MPGADSPPILIVTVTHNTGEVLRAFLRSARTATSAPTEIVVVDNASADTTVEREACAEFGAEFLALDENLGYGGGIEEGVRHGSPDAEFLVIANPDVEFSRGSVDELVRVLRERPAAGSAGPRILNVDGTVYPSARSLPSLRTGIGHAIFGRIWPGNPWTRRYRGVDYESDAVRPVGWLSGACLVVRRDAYEQIGGFDTSYFMYFEDVDLGARLSKAAWANLYAPTASVVHTGAHSTSTASRRMEAVHHESAYRYLSRKYTGWYLLPVRVVLWVGLRVRQWWVTR
ncbi:MULTISPECIES: glycosyltransferase family 2 protein [unclassified Leifsonia]|uniref:glycosyltransferase family 2 protein n=1 Tax=unclassified Leifsonia TaxID=2663824 RepID=UPI00037BDC7C|nr:MULTISPECIES: glycosyltransferase family 2 protein [unclassified Leifsonia]TDQ02851.1 N-acetylglucosaminyl-diphospho-decaprenol L-rhamnosyltransferase [Leifsonia sp. 115AMFTsu3.1]